MDPPGHRHRIESLGGPGGPSTAVGTLTNAMGGRFPEYALWSSRGRAQPGARALAKRWERRLEAPLFHALGNLPEPKSTHRFC